MRRSPPADDGVTGPGSGAAGAGAVLRLGRGPVRRPPPGYPADAVAFLARRTGRGGSSTWVPAPGCSPRWSARRARGRGRRPGAGDAGQLAARLPGVATAVGTAEAVPVGDAAVDAVVAGQAAHWFDPAPAAREIRRVLRPGGVVGLIWNTRDERVPWVAALGELIAAEARGHEADQGVVERFAAELDAASRCLESGIVQARHARGGGRRHRHPQLRRRSWTTSARAAFLGRIRELLATHPDTRGRDGARAALRDRGVPAHARADVSTGRVPTANTRRNGSSVVPSGRAG